MLADEARNILEALVPLPVAIVDRLWARALDATRWVGDAVDVYLRLARGRECPEQQGETTGPIHQPGRHPRARLFHVGSAENSAMLHLDNDSASLCTDRTRR